MCSTLSRCCCCCVAEPAFASLAPLVSLSEYDICGDDDDDELLELSDSTSPPCAGDWCIWPKFVGNGNWNLGADTGCSCAAINSEFVGPKLGRLFIEGAENTGFCTREPGPSFESESVREMVAGYSAWLCWSFTTTMDHFLALSE
ncbi:hypothetical protein OGAPHI_007136 [Ogataea philodendri]|uniref:Uncharacterized protein n=1 Tax=Ogataea philodendri TaxID=1378263 RepID=A0A9P8NW09_9ASCO|nr:uncharacterized protein OGAPHI_007136 [Ogataea philodendri]KAH3660550.1 hypothetical protein OGAPHI_007136 [Ogataea philodendri]